MTARRWRHLFVPGALVVVAVLLVGVQSRHHDDIPVPGETSQLDYVLALPHVPARGDLVSDDAVVPSGSSANELPEGPYSLAGGTPPAYYVVTAVIARTAAAMTGSTTLSVGRALGALWLALFLLAAYTLARDVGAPALTAGAAAVAVGATTSLSTSASYLSSDTAGAAVGGLVLLMAWRYDGTRHSLWWRSGRVRACRCHQAVGGHCGRGGRDHARGPARRDDPKCRGRCPSGVVEGDARRRLRRSDGLSRPGRGLAGPD